MMQAGISALVLKTHFEEITNPDYVINRNLKSENMCTTDTCACIPALFWSKLVRELCASTFIATVWTGPFSILT